MAEPECPLHWEVGREAIKAKQTVVLPRKTCPDHEFLSFSTASVAWTRDDLTVKVGWKNDFQSDRTAVLKVEFIRENGWAFPGRTITKNLDSDKSGGSTFKFSLPISDIAGARFTLRVAGD